MLPGACQSNFEAIINRRRQLCQCTEASSNPLSGSGVIAQEVAFTPVSQFVDLRELIGSTITGKEGIGGIETRGKFRLGFPRAC